MNFFRILPTFSGFSSLNAGIQVKKLKKEHVKEQLETRGIIRDINTNKNDLIKELEIVLAEDTLAKISSGM